MRKDCRDPRAGRMNFLVEIAFTFGVGMLSLFVYMVIETIHPDFLSNYTFLIII